MSKSALGVTALKVDLFVSRMAEVEDRALTDWQREFRAKVLTDYKVFRDAHPVGGFYAT